MAARVIIKSFLYVVVSVVNISGVKNQRQTELQMTQENCYMPLPPTGGQSIKTNKAKTLA